MNNKKSIRTGLTTLRQVSEEKVLPQVRKGISKAKNGLFADKTAIYHWVMNMNPDQKVPIMRGYGKIEGHKENHSKIQNLMRIFLMLYERQFFVKTSRIVIYERTAGPLCNPDLDTQRLIITPGQILYTPSFIDHEDVPFVQFLTNFDLCIKNGINPRIHLRPINTK